MSEEIRGGETQTLITHLNFCKWLEDLLLGFKNLTVTENEAADAVGGGGGGVENLLNAVAEGNGDLRWKRILNIYINPKLNKKKLH